jgi:peptide deformylase
MAIRNIIQVGDETLRKKSVEVTEFDDKLHVLLDDMADTLKYADGAGLAAPQVGVLKRVFIVMIDGVILADTFTDSSIVCGVISLLHAERLSIRAVNNMYLK